MQRDLGSYDYVQRVYNENMRLAAYKLPQTAADGDVTFIDDGLIKLTSTWIQNYEETTSTHGPSRGIVKGMLADYNTTADNVLTVSLTRVSGKALE